LISGFVAVSIVDVLEFIQIDKQKGQSAGPSLGGNHGLLQPVPHELPVRQSGQGIAVGELHDPAFREVHEISQERPLPVHVNDVDRSQNPLDGVLSGQYAKNEKRVHLLLQRGPDAVLHMVPVFRKDHRQRIDSPQFARRTAANVAEGLVGKNQPAALDNADSERGHIQQKADEGIQLVDLPDGRVELEFQVAVFRESFFQRTLNFE